MEVKEEVHSDDGSYEFVNFDDFSSNMDQSSDGSYDFLSSDLSDILVLTEGVSNNIPLNDDDISAQIKSFSLNSPSVDSEYEESDEEEEYVDMDFAESEEEMSADMDITANRYNNMGKKRHYFRSYHKLTNKKKIKDVAKTHILCYLPAKSLARCRLVCKEWDSWISTPLFAHTQSHSFTKTSGFFQANENGLIRFISLDHVSYGVPHPTLNFLPKKVSIKSSSHGLLLCQAINNESEYYVCNPANKQFIEIPNSSYHHGKNPKIVLAFEPSSRNFQPFYQIISPFSVPNEEHILKFDIYDSDTKSWRISKDTCVDLDAYDLKSDGVSVNGVVYWETTGGKLLAFDLKNEIHGVQTLSEDGAFLKVHGELCYVKGYYHHSIKMCILHVYDDGLLSSKRNLCFGVPFGDDVVDCRVLGNTCDDVVAFVLKRSGGQNGLFVYNVKERKVEGPWFLGSYDKLFPYVNSLVSIAPYGYSL